jgi:hypothetical protein
VSQTVAWRKFKRCQDGAAVAAALILASAMAYGWWRLPSSDGLRTQAIIVFPAVFLLASGLVPMLIGPLRRALMHYVWGAFDAGFGQTATSVAIAVALTAGVALFVFWRVGGVIGGGGYPVGVLCGLATGLGVLLAQTLLARRLEREPEVRAVIEVGAGV